MCRRCHGYAPQRMLTWTDELRMGSSLRKAALSGEHPQAWRADSCKARQSPHRWNATDPATAALPLCAEMRIIAFITEAPAMRPILIRLGLPIMPATVAPARGPPPWDMPDARQRKIDPQPAPDYEFDRIGSPPQPKRPRVRDRFVPEATWAANQPPSSWPQPASRRDPGVAFRLLRHETPD